MSAPVATARHNLGVTDYTWTAHLATVACDWSLQGDEWLYRFTAAVGAEDSAIRVTGHRYDLTTQPFIQVKLSEEENALDVVVLLAVTTDAVHVFAAGQTEPNDALIEQLAVAAQVASVRLGDEGQDHPWSAVVGYASERISGGEKRLAAEAIIGSMRLVSTETVLIEPDTSSQISLSSWAIHASTPIRVYGTSRGYSWDAASPRAARDLHTLCGLLSVAWNSPIVVREGAAPLDWGDRHVPRHPPWYQSLDDSGDEGRPADGEAVTLPPWLDEAWARTQSAAYLVAALDAFLEGAHSAHRHPSLAAVAFTASVETIASRLYRLQHCTACGASRGIGRAFKAALRNVVDEAEASVLDSVYSKRSKTVHAGVLHGGETRPGVISASIWSADPSRDFRWQTLRRLQGASRQLLEWALTTDLPSRAPLPGPETSPERGGED